VPEVAVVGAAEDAGAAAAVGGHDDELALGAGTLADTAAEPLVRTRLNSRQHGGHRHSRTIDPSGPLNLVSRHPNWALMSV
jgi:hypothetical protein